MMNTATENMVLHGDMQVIQTASDRGIVVVYNPSLRCAHKFIPVHLKFSWDNQLEDIWEMDVPLNSLLVDGSRIGAKKPNKAAVVAKLDEELAALQKKLIELQAAKEEVSNS